MANATEEDLEQLKEMWKAWKRQDGEIDHSAVWKKAHKLAEAHYLPAIEFFVAGLNDMDWVWREDCLSFLGFHYSLKNRIEIVEKFREMVVSDPSDDVRMTAAAVLGLRSKLPDQALFHALESDLSYFVREAAFESVLELMGLPYKTINREVKRFKTGQVQSNFEYFKQIAKDESIEFSESLLMKLDGQLLGHS